MLIIDQIASKLQSRWTNKRKNMGEFRHCESRTAMRICLISSREEEEERNKNWYKCWLASWENYERY